MEVKVNGANEFLNKRIIITGASSGIGKSCALYFLNSGAKVVLCGRDMESLKKIGEKFPEQAAAIQVDLSGDMQLFDFKSSVIEILGGLDIIINCAGAIFDGDVEKTFPQDYDYLIDVNLRSIFALILHFKTYLEKGSCVVNVSCLNGSRPQAGLASYCMTKAGLEIMTKFAAAEFAHLGVRVNGVSSCAVDTNILRSVGIDEKEYSDYKTRVSNNIPLGRIAKPEDVAKQIIFLCSKRSSKITGQILKVDGGKSLTSSGYTPWKGLKNMNARFEPSDVNSNYKVLSIWSNLSKKNVNKNYPNTEEEIEKLLNETNWATRLSEAHEKVTASYKSIDQNDNFLVNKFVKKN